MAILHRAVEVVLKTDLFNTLNQWSNISVIPLFIFGPKQTGLYRMLGPSGWVHHSLLLSPTFFIFSFLHDIRSNSTRGGVGRARDVAAVGLWQPPPQPPGESAGERRAREEAVGSSKHNPRVFPVASCGGRRRAPPCEQSRRPVATTTPRRGIGLTRPSGDVFFLFFFFFFSERFFLLNF
jgi:hypothetical protein